MLKNSEITMSFHPRAFSAFGSELVTNASVAMTELIKNSYDAFASGVMIVFGNDSDEHYIEIIDDGLGMSQEIVSTSWAVVATPFKKNNPSVERNGRIRYVSGNKGLGRFSAARLGQKMSIITKCKDDICFSAEIDWNSFENAEAINNCKIALREYPEQELLSCIRKSLRTDSRTGTIIRIAGLNEEWNYEKIESLKLALARLISPFEQVDDFKIFIQLGDANGPVDIRPHDFIKNPVYRISGYVSELGDVHWKYSFSPGERQQKYDEGVIPWNSAKDGFDKGAATRELTEIKSVRYGSGEFSFEIRAWDLDSESVADISETFNIKKSEIRKTIAQYKGISVYRDRVLEKFYMNLLKTKAVPRITDRKGAKVTRYVTPSTVRKIHNLLKSCFHQAVKWDLIEKNPAVYATVPKAEEKRRDMWDGPTLFHAIEVCEDERLKMA